MRNRLTRSALACGLGLLAGAASPCEQAALDAEKSFDLPAGLMLAIGRVESGRYDTAAGRVIAWPWTIDVGGNGQQFENVIDAVRTTQSLRASGVRNIDVGCFQVSLLYHPNAFETLEEAFDPPANGRYAGRLLASLKARLGTWPEAVAAYHSADPARGTPYREKVYASWQGAPPTIEPVSEPEPVPLPFGIHLWTPSRPGTAPSLIHIGPEPALPWPKVTVGLPH